MIQQIFIECMLRLGNTNVEQPFMLWVNFQSLFMGIKEGSWSSHLAASLFFIEKEVRHLLRDGAEWGKSEWFKMATVEMKEWRTPTQRTVEWWWGSTKEGRSHVIGNEVGVSFRHPHYLSAGSLQPLGLALQLWCNNRKMKEWRMLAGYWGIGLQGLTKQQKKKSGAKWNPEWVTLDGSVR